jgi:hypothetical protein
MRRICAHGWWWRSRMAPRFRKLRSGSGVSISSVVRFRRLHRETGSVGPAKFGGYKGLNERRRFDSEAGD